MKQLRVLCVFGLLIVTAACGGGSETGQDSSAPAGSASASSSSRVVGHEQLLALLPAIPEWARSREPQGTTDPAESVSRVQVDYEPTGADESSGFSVEIMDTSGNNNMLGPLRDFIKANRTTQSGGGSATPVQVLGHRGMQEWMPEARNGTLSLLVADRFTVGITGNYISDPAFVQKVAETIDLKTRVAQVGDSGELRQ